MHGERSESVKAKLLDIKINLKQPWLLAVLFVAVIPVFPEYICPLLAGGALWAAHLDAKARGRQISVGLLGNLLLVYLLYMAFGVLYSRTPFFSLSTFLMWTVVFMAYTAVCTVLTNKHRFDTALFCVCLIAGVVGLIAFFQYTLRMIFGADVPLQFWEWVDRAVYAGTPWENSLDITGLRSSSTFNNPNTMAEYLVMVLPFVLYYSYSGQRTGARLLCRFCLLAAVMGIAFSFSRGSYLALLVIVLAFCIANIRKIQMILLSIVSLLVLIPDSVFARFFSVNAMDSSTAERFHIWGISLRNIVENPLFGLGPGVQNSSDMLAAGGINAPHTHNLVLQLLIEGGIIGLGLMVFIGWKMFRRSVHMVRWSPDSRMLGVVFIAFVGAFCMHGMVDYPLLTPKLIAVFMMVLALSDSAARLYMGSKVQSLADAMPYAVLRRRMASGIAYYQK